MKWYTQLLIVLGLIGVLFNASPVQPSYGTSGGSDLSYVLDYPSHRLMLYQDTMIAFESVRRVLSHMSMYVKHESDGGIARINTDQAMIDLRLGIMQDNINMIMHSINDDPMLSQSDKNNRLARLDSMLNLITIWHRDAAVPIAEANKAGDAESVYQIFIMNASLIDELLAMIYADIELEATLISEVQQ
jgi:hypothetical protein